MYGSALPMQYTIERNALANMSRTAPMRSNYHGLKVHIGDYNKVDVKDFIGKNKAVDVDENIFRKIEKTYFD